MACLCAGKAVDNVAMSPYYRENLLEVRMVGKSKGTFRQQAQVLKALANESRLKIIDRLSRGECSVGELTDLVGSDRSTISKHLALLRAHGIVLDRREGNVVYYTLLTPCVVNFFSCATQVLKERA
jgi:DNA-binding transcriptional ArsR family regulator